MSPGARRIGALRAGGEGLLARRLTTVAFVAATVLAAHATPQTPASLRLGYLALVTVTAAGCVAWTLLGPHRRARLACLVVVAGAGGLLAVASDDRDGVAAALIFAAFATGTAAQAYRLGPALGVAAVATAALLAERMRVAREVHDVLAHSLTALAISLETAEVLLDERNDVAGGLERVRRARALAVDGLAETRGAVAALRGAPVPLPESLERLLADYRGDTAAEATLAITGDRRALAAEPALALRRIAQEAVTNVRRHAPGAPVDAALHFDAATVRLSVSNSITGLAPARPSPGGGHGIHGMRERAEACGGWFRAGVVHGHWRIDVEVPA